MNGKKQIITAFVICDDINSIDPRIKVDDISYDCGLCSFLIDVKIYHKDRTISLQYILMDNDTEGYDKILNLLGKTIS